MTFQITVFCMISRGGDVKKGAVYPLDFYRKMYYNYIKARFYADICTNDIYSILQASAKVKRINRPLFDISAPRDIQKTVI